ncbi:hypothetical protein DGG96_02370 [Legionella qingyii]|uniref:Uncharacterized protein n=1 Tax=Legionella qingyii TaxID=2184757 RepID=A0A317U5I8_9GAMM|nr:hypothetical protein DGG96_06820 [Legionella qingyii]PWY57175.1 hypothetical protein DGG96_02370 [Legionella qingyii]
MCTSSPKVTVILIFSYDGREDSRSRHSKKQILAYVSSRLGEKVPIRANEGKGLEDNHSDFLPITIYECVLNVYCGIIKIQNDVNESRFYIVQIGTSII